MLRASGVGARIDCAGIGALPGALQALAEGLHSSLQKSNSQSLEGFQCDELLHEPMLQLLADPQTSGGLLAGLPGDRAEDCVQQLQRSGYAAACVVGEVRDRGWRLC